MVGFEQILGELDAREEVTPGRRSRRDERRSRRPSLAAGSSPHRTPAVRLVAIRRVRGGPIRPPWHLRRSSLLPEAKSSSILRHSPAPGACELPASQTFRVSARGATRRWASVKGIRPSCRSASGSCNPVRWASPTRRSVRTPCLTAPHRPRWSHPVGGPSPSGDPPRGHEHEHRRGRCDEAGVGDRPLPGPLATHPALYCRAAAVHPAPLGVDRRCGRVCAGWPPTSAASRTPRRRPS